MAFSRKDLEGICDVWERNPDDDACRKLGLAMGRQLLESLGGEPAHAGRERDRERARGTRVFDGVDRHHGLPTARVGAAPRGRSSTIVTLTDEPGLMMVRTPDADALLDALVPPKGGAG
jgi:hypothetical protein